MKQIKIILYIVTLMLAACATNETAKQGWHEPGIGNEGQTLISLSASETVRVAATRAETDIQTGLFDADEILQGYVTLNTEPATNFSPLLTTREASNGVNPLVANQQLYWPVDPTKTISVYALYPQTVTSATTNFTVSDDQRTDEAYKASDLMWGGDHTNHTALTTSYDAENATLNIPFQHKMAKLVVNAATDGSVSGVVINGITVKNVDRTIAFTPTTGVLGALSGEATGSIQMSNNGACLLPPQTIVAGAAFIEVSVTIGSIDYTATYKVGGALEMLEGYQYTLNIIVGSQSLGLTSTINDWSSVSNTHIITPKEFGSISMAEVTDDFTYDGTEKRPEPIVTAAGVGTLTKGTDFDYTYFANTNAGTNTALVVATGKSGTDYVGQVAVQKFSIQKATPDIILPTKADGLTYNSTAYAAATSQKLLTAAGSTNFGELRYSVDRFNWYPDFDDDAISQTNANPNPGHTVYLNVEESNNWNGLETTVSVPIAKRIIDDWSLSQTSKLTVASDDSEEVTINLGGVYAGDITDYGTVTVKNGSTELVENSEPVGASVAEKIITIYGNESTTSDQTLTVTIADGTNYIFEGSKTFDVEVESSGPTLADIGKIMGSDGKIYLNVSAALAANVTPSGMIAYLDNNGNGMCIALADCASSATWGTANSNAQSFNVALPERATSGWFLPSSDDFSNMIDANNGCRNGPNLWDMKGRQTSSCGGTALKRGSDNSYWTSTSTNINGVYWAVFCTAKGAASSTNRANPYNARAVFTF